MSITGLVVHAHPNKTDSVRLALLSFKGVEVHAATPDGKLIVTLDNPSDAEAADTLYGLKDVDGVLSTALVYTHFEEQETGT